MQLSHFFPAVEPVKLRSSHVMSELYVLDEFGSEGSRLLLSMHADAQGEFGATCRAEMCPERSTETSRVHARAAIISPARAEYRNRAGEGS